MDFSSCPPIVRRPENVTKKMQEQKTAFVLQTPHTTQHLCGTITTFRWWEHTNDNAPLTKKNNISCFLWSGSQSRLLMLQEWWQPLQRLSEMFTACESDREVLWSTGMSAGPGVCGGQWLGLYVPTVCRHTIVCVARAFILWQSKTRQYAWLSIMSNAEPVGSGWCKRCCGALAAGPGVGVDECTYGSMHWLKSVADVYIFAWTKSK